MKKYSINYFSWITWVLVHSLGMAVFAFGVYKGLTYEKKYSMDFVGKYIGNCYVRLPWNHLLGNSNTI